MELATKNIEFDYLNQHVRCLAHVINLAAQQALNSLKAISNTNEEEFLDEDKNDEDDENENNDEQIIGETANLLHKVNYYLFVYYILILLILLKINYFLASYSYL